MMTNVYPMTINHIFISPGHNYFGHKKPNKNKLGRVNMIEKTVVETSNAHETYDVTEVQARANLGLEGDRFYGVRPDFDGQVTFFAWEVYELLMNELGLADESVVDLRRNIITTGVPFNALIGQEFTIGEVRFFGAKHCAPCSWMDTGLAPGALKLLKGRGGLRAQVLSDGRLYRGETTLESAISLATDNTAILQRLERPRLP